MSEMSDLCYLRKPQLKPQMILIESPHTVALKHHCNLTCLSPCHIESCHERQ